MEWRFFSIREKTKHFLLGRERQIDIRPFLQDSEFYDYVNHLPSNLNCISEEGIILWANHTELTWLGYTKEEYIGQNLNKFYLEDPEENGTFLNLLATKQQVRGHDIKVICRDGSIKDVRVNSNICHQDQKFYSRCVFEDIGELSFLKKEVEQLQVAKNALEVGNHETNLLIVTMSHELRSPLNVIVGCTDELLALNPTHEAAEILKILVDSAKNLQAMMNDTLDTAKLDSKNLAIKLNPFFISDLLQPLEHTIQQAAGKKRIFFETICEQKHVKVIGDVVRITQVLTNLLNNAIKFTDTGGVILDVAFRPFSHEFANLTFTIKDTGMGVPLDQEKHLFTEFFQTHQSSMLGGTGIGLSLCRKLVTIMGGTIGYDRNSPTGSIFWFSLPLRWEDNEIHATKMPKIQPNPLQIPKGTLSGKILLVEDSVVNQVVMAKHFQYLGCNFDVAVNGEEGISFAVSTAYDLILMDVQMPIKGGVEATKDLRERGVNTPIIALTAGNTLVQKDACMEAGMNGFLAKPVNRKEIYELLRCYLRSVAPTI